MKKHLVLVLSMMLVLGFTASAFAIHAVIPAETTAVVAPKGTEVRLGGELRIRGWHEQNITNAAGTAKAVVGRPYDAGSMSWYDQRVRLLLDIKTAPNVTGRIHLETDPMNYTWGGTNTIAAAGAGGAKRGDRLNLLEAWIAYTGKGLLGVTSGIKAGHMPIVIGEGTFFDHRFTGDDAIMLWIEPAKGTEINLVTAKLFEGGVTTTTGNTWTAPGVITTTTGGTTDNTDDLDLYSLMLTHKAGKDHTIGANLSLITASDAANYAGGFYRMPAAWTTTTTRTASLNLWNLGLNAKGKAAGLGYKATADFQFGEAKDIGLAPLAREQKFSGYGLTAGVDYKVDPVTLRANYVYGSGDSDARDIAANTKNKAFQTFVGGPINPTLPTVVYGWRVDTAAGSGIRGTGISNTTAYNLGLTFSPLKDMTAHLDYYLLRASERLTAVPTPNEYGNSKDIGSEVDLKIVYRLARNLTYSINSGILFAGDFYKAAATGVTSNPKDAFVFQHQLVLSF